MEWDYVLILLYSVLLLGLIEYNNISMVIKLIIFDLNTQ